MAIELPQWNLSAPGGVIIGLIGEEGSGAAEVAAAAGRSGMIVLDQTLARLDALARERELIELQRRRRDGETILIASHDEELLAALCDEVWWMDAGKAAGRGDPAVVLDAYRRHIAAKLRSGRHPVELTPRWRRGDGRAEIAAIDLVGEDGGPAAAWRSGEQVAVQVTVRFRAAVEDPVVGILIRTRVGLNVYGTNTELEGLKLGPCAAGDRLRVNFAFRCDLCPQEYTLTAASHDPDGVWHEWLEDAVAFSVSDTRHTAGVANLRARASVERV